MPDVTSLHFLGAELTTHHPGKKGPRKLETHWGCAMGNRYGDRQNSQSINMGGTNEDNTIVRVHLLKHSTQITSWVSFNFFQHPPLFWNPILRTSHHSNGNWCLGCQNVSRGSYPAILDVFKEPLQVPIFSSIKDAPLFFHLSNFIHSFEKETFPWVPYS